MEKKEKLIRISFMGIDGTGKTTQANLLQQALSEKGICSYYFHLFSSQTKIAGKATKNSMLGAWLSKMDSMSDTKAGTLAELLIRLPSLILESWLTNISNKSNNSVIIYDRYFYDKIISTLCSYTKNLNSTTKTLIIATSVLINRPDVILSFQLTPQAAIKRKKEHSLQEAKEISKFYDQLNRILSITPINAELGIDEISREIQGKVFPKLKNS